MNNMKNNICLALLFLTSAPLLASEWELGIGVYKADISGFNAFKASGNFNEQITEDLTVPFLFVEKSIGSKYNLTFRYSYYDEIVTNGVSSTSNIFNDTSGCCVYTQANVDYRFFESMREVSVSMNYILVNSDKWKIQAGPSLSITSVNSDMYMVDLVGTIGSDVFVEQLTRKLEKFSETSYSPGAEAKVSYIISKRVNLNLNYKFSSLSEKNIHLLGASVAFGF